MNSRVYIYKVRPLSRRSGSRAFLLSTTTKKVVGIFPDSLSQSRGFGGAMHCCIYKKVSQANVL